MTGAMVSGMMVMSCVAVVVLPDMSVTVQVRVITVGEVPQAADGMGGLSEGMACKAPSQLSVASRGKPTGASPAQSTVVSAGMGSVITGGMVSTQWMS